jgi:hypothetical protein
MLVTKRIGSIAELNHFLQGGIFGGVDLRRTASSLYLNGLTLVFNAPTGTVTFSAANQQPLTILEVATQIKAQLVTVTPRIIEGRLWIVEATVAAGVDLDATGTANQLLGFSTTDDTVGVVYGAPGGTAPTLVSISPGGGTDSEYIVTTDEA